MNIIESTIASVDKWQRHNRFAAFPYSVIKKYGEDEAGYQSALLTYYGFLSLFPLLLVVTTLLSIFGGHNEALRQTIFNGLNHYFPTFGNQLSGHIQGIHKSGIPLVIGILFSLYGARGVAEAFRSGVNNIWQTPRVERIGFPLSIVNSLSIMGVAGAGFLLASVISSYAAAAGHGVLFWLLSIGVNIFILFWMFRFLLNLALPNRVPSKQTRSAALAAAIGLVVLQLVGNLVISHELKTLDSVYSYFALPLGLLFWIYLQAQIIYYAVEIASVRSLSLYPRGIVNTDLTPADKRAYAQLARREQVTEKERIKTKFR